MFDFIKTKRAEVNRKDKRDLEILPDLPTGELEAFLTYEDVALFLRVNPQTIRNWVSQDRDGFNLRPYRTPFGPRFLLSEVQDFIRQIAATGDGLQ